MADPIKSVRARQKNTGLSELDLKVSIYKSGILNNKRKVSVTDKLGNPISGKDPIDFPTNDRYSNYTDNDFIKDYLDTIVKLDPNKSNQPYEIIQDPWDDKFKEPRLFGFTPYYLNDGSFIRITWTKSGDRASSKKDDADSSIEKKVELFPPENAGLTKWYVMSASNIFVFSDDKIITEDEDYREYTGLLKDIDILKIVIPIIKSQIEKKFGEKASKNKLSLCSPNDQTCNLIPFRNFLDDQPKIEKPKEEKEEPKIKTTDGSETNASGTKVKLTAKPPVNVDIIQNKDIPPIVIFAGKEENPELEVYRQEDPMLEDENLLGEEYQEFNYTEPDPLAKDEIQDPNDENRGSPSAEAELVKEVQTTNISTIAPTKTSDPAGVRQRLKEATESTGSNSGGKCARFTFNHANNFIRLLIGKESQGSKNSAGGNANQEGYHAALEKMGYKRVDQGTVSKAQIISSLNNKSLWNIGDVIAYWGVNPAPGEVNEGGVKYGHTQIFTDGAHGSPHLWTTDNVGNFKCNFVYGRYKTDQWRFIIFKSPTTTEDGKKKMGFS